MRRRVHCAGKFASLIFLRRVAELVYSALPRLENYANVRELRAKRKAAI